MPMDGSTPETCEKCGFDSRRWRLRDAATLFEELGWWWENATAGFDVNALNRRPGPAVWSILEYGLHTALAAAVIRTEIEAIFTEDGCTLDVDFDIGDATEDNWALIDAARALADIEREGTASARLARRQGAPWRNVGFFGEHRLQAEAYLIHDAHDASHHMMDASRGLAALSNKSAIEGRLVQVSVSDGGVPKRPVQRAVVTAGGLQGDRQHERRHHGRPFQAVCIWSADVIDELSAAGHPIAPGSAGENLTLRGVDWGTLRPGALIWAGQVLLELSFPATPCRKQAQWFSDGDFSRIAHEVNPRWARWYGWVRAPGEVHPGERIIVQA
jgi:MOSC domain-containing protein YiiM